MKDNIKNTLGVAAAVALIVVSASSLLYVRSYDKSTQPSSFSVSAEGKVVAIPDVAKFSVGVITQGDLNLGTIQNENADKSNSIVSFLKNQGIDEKDIKTQGYSIEPRYQYGVCRYEGETCPPPTIVGYTVSQQLEVKGRDFEKLGDILSGVVERGANSVSGLSFTVDDQIQLEQQAREEAIAKAKEKAKAIAKSGGFRLGRLIQLSEGSIYIPQYVSDYGIGGAGAVAKGPSLEPGSQEVSIQVSLIYEIE
ncbi:MAG: SIMPL domain-containing protein [Parcubacteria group bacterium]|nr:SIMPL domain-containing protein [Parcubacteria group bacterium]